MLVPNFIFNKLVYTEGPQKGHITEEWEVYFSQLQGELQTNFSNEGLVVPSQPSLLPDNFGIIQPNALVGTLLFDETNDELNVKLQDGEFHPLQIGGEAVLVIDGTIGDISAVRIGQTVTLDLVNTTVTPGSYSYPAEINVDPKGRITFIESGSEGPVLEVLGTTNETVVSTVAGVATVALAPNPIIPGTGSLTVPSGTIAERPTPSNGLRYNSDTNVYELYYPTIPSWETIDTAGGTVTGVFGTSGQIIVTPNSPNPVVSIDPTYAGQTSINTLGTITTGAWHGSIITGTYGGTGINNGSNTITIGGNLAFTGAYTFTGTLTGNTNVTFPTSGTLSTTTGTVTGITAGTGLTGGTINTSGTIALSTPVSLANGGTNASLTGSANSLVYSTSSAFALLSTANNGVLITSNTGVPSISSTLPIGVQANITTVGAITVGTWEGFQIGTIYGGTGLSLSSITNGQLLIGSTAGNDFALATLTAGSGVSITNGSNSITISATGTGGTVTSVSGTTGQIDVSNPTTTPVISIDAGYIGQTSITTLGTVTTGVWNSSLITGTYGGTGINNGSKTITLGGNLTTSGAFNSTFTMTAATNVTFPTSGTLATTSQLPTPAALTSNNDTNVTLTLGGTPSTALLQASSITAGWTGTLALARGGLGANLTASNGGIFYSTASAGAILAGTSTASQVLLSGSSTTPAWSTATYPATTTINQLLYSSANNTVSGLTTANSSILVTNSSGVPSLSTSLPSFTMTGNINTNAANTNNVGSSSTPFNNMYAQNLWVSSNGLSAYTGTYVLIGFNNGGTVQDCATYNCRPVNNNANTCGTSSNRWSTTYTQLLNVAGISTLTGNVQAANSVGWSSQTSWDLNITLQGPNLVNTQARCPGWNTYSGAQFKDFIDYADTKELLKIARNIPIRKYYWKKGYYDNQDFFIKPGKAIHPHHSELEKEEDGKIKEYCIDGEIHHKQIYKKQLHIGPFAQDIYELFPQAATISENGIPEAIDYGKLSILFAGGLQEMANIQDLLIEEIKMLRNAISKLEQKLQK